MAKRRETKVCVELKIFTQTTSFNKHLHFWKPWTPHSTSCSKRGLIFFFKHCPLQDCNYRPVTKSHPSTLFISFTLALSPFNSNTLACGDRLKESSILAFDYRPLHSIDWSVFGQATLAVHPNLKANINSRPHRLAPFQCCAVRSFVTGTE